MECCKAATSDYRINEYLGHFHNKFDFRPTGSYKVPETAGGLDPESSNILQVVTSPLSIVSSCDWLLTCRRGCAR